jgi:hypothetical protein
LKGEPIRFGSLPAVNPGSLHAVNTVLTPERRSKRRVAMVSNQVTCITKPHPHSPREHITHVGGLNANGDFWYFTRERLANMIDSGQYNFHVRVGGYDVPVRSYVLHGVKYIRTAADDTIRDNLLSLDQCPVRRVA